MKKIKMIIKYILLLISSIWLFLFTLALVINFSICDSSYVISHLKKTNYYKELYEDIRTEMTYYTNQSGFQDDIIDDTFTIDDVTNDVNSFVTSYYNNKKYTVDTSKFIKSLNKKIDDHIVDNNFTITNRNEIDDFVLDMAGVYSNKIKLMNYADMAISRFNKLIKKINKITIILGICFIVSLLIYKICFKRKQIPVILYTNTFLIFSLLLYIKSRIKIGSIFIYGKLLSNVIISIINNLFLILMIIAIIYIIIGIILTFLRKRLKYNE